mgnify:CR=1 FL=1
MKSIITLLFTLALTLSVSAQSTALERGTDNITVEGHIPLGGPLSVMDMEIEQEMHRPYAYVGRGHLGDFVAKGMDIIDLSDPSSPTVIKRWRIENEALHTGLGGMDVKYFKWADRYYVVQSIQFGPGPNESLGAVVFDVTYSEGNPLPPPFKAYDAVKAYEADVTV